MAEERVSIQSGDLTLEGLLGKKPGERGVVVTHPHPLYGGEMNNNVVEAVVQAYAEEGYSTLRFNFRGVGRSEGRYSEGVGEQEDVRAALGYLSVLGINHLDLAGYSFGAWVNALGIEVFDQVDRLIMVSPPANFIDFDFLEYNKKIGLVVVGSRDDIAGPDLVERMISKWNPDALFKKIEGSDHFYWGYTDQLKIIIKEYLEW
jgi:alpha/beta superfamily hydrolase